MTNLILTTPEELKQIITDCLVKFYPAQNSQPESPPPILLYSIDELATFLGCCNQTAFKLKKSGQVRYRQFGRKLVFNSAEVLEDLKKKKR
jgi:hypothetical protein